MRGKDNREKRTKTVRGEKNKLEGERGRQMRRNEKVYYIIQERRTRKQIVKKEQ